MHVGFHCVELAMDDPCVVVLAASGQVYLLVVYRSNTHITTPHPAHNCSSKAAIVQSEIHMYSVEATKVLHV